jgi:hypothetical protein
MSESGFLGFKDLLDWIFKQNSAKLSTFNHFKHILTTSQQVGVKKKAIFGA